MLKFIKIHWLELTAFKILFTLLILASIDIHHRVNILFSEGEKVIDQQHESFQDQLKMQKMLTDAFYEKDIK